MGSTARKVKRNRNRKNKHENLRILKQSEDVAKSSFVIFCEAVKMMSFRKRLRFCWSIMTRGKLK